MDMWVMNTGRVELCVKPVGRGVKCVWSNVQV